MANRMREDVESAYLDITEFTGQSLTGPRDLISRKVLCSNTQILMSDEEAANQANGAAAAVRTGKADKLQQLNFRLLSTSPGACLNAKVELVVPMIFHHCVSSEGGQVANKPFRNYKSRVQCPGSARSSRTPPKWTSEGV